MQIISEYNDRVNILGATDTVRGKNAGNNA